MMYKVIGLEVVRFRTYSIVPVLTLIQKCAIKSCPDQAQICLMNALKIPPTLTDILIRKNFQIKNLVKKAKNCDEIRGTVVIYVLDIIVIADFMLIS